MHLFNTAILFVVLTLLGVEFSVSAFMNPAASRLEPESQLEVLSRSALVLGKVMPVWYSVSTLLLGVQTWLCWHTPGRAILLIVDAIMILIAAASIFFLVPLAGRPRHRSFSARIRRSPLRWLDIDTLIELRWITVSRKKNWSRFRSACRIACSQT
jgi:hypothetical protein